MGGAAAGNKHSGPARPLCLLARSVVSRRFEEERMSTVVVATSGTESELQAFMEAFGLLQGGLDYVFVASAGRPRSLAPMPGPGLGTAFSAPGATTATLEESRDTIRLRLERFAERAGIKADIRVETGDLAALASGVADEVAADLVVACGRQYPSVLARLTGTSVARELAGRAQRPVLVVSPL
jgi:nucleotide-binding universal stress UspA family protein